MNVINQTAHGTASFIHYAFYEQKGASSANDGSVLIWDIEPLSITATIHLPFSVQSMIWIREGDQLVIIHEQGAWYCDGTGMVLHKISWEKGGILQFFPQPFETKDQEGIIVASSREKGLLMVNSDGYQWIALPELQGQEVSHAIRYQDKMILLSDLKTITTYSLPDATAKTQKLEQDTSSERISSIFADDGRWVKVTKDELVAYQNDEKSIVSLQALGLSFPDVLDWRGDVIFISEGTKNIEVSLSGKTRISEEKDWFLWTKEHNQMLFYIDEKGALSKKQNSEIWTIPHKDSDTVIEFYDKHLYMVDGLSDVFSHPQRTLSSNLKKIRQIDIEAGMFAALESSGRIGVWTSEDSLPVFIEDDSGPIIDMVWDKGILYGVTSHGTLVQWDAKEQVAQRKKLRINEVTALAIYNEKPYISSAFYGIQSVEGESLNINAPHSFVRHIEGGAALGISTEKSFIVKSNDDEKIFDIKAVFSKCSDDGLLWSVVDKKGQLHLIKSDKSILLNMPRRVKDISWSDNTLFWAGLNSGFIKVDDLSSIYVLDQTKKKVNKYSEYNEVLEQKSIFELDLFR